MLSKNLLTELIKYFDGYADSIRVKDIDQNEPIEQRIAHSYRVMEHVEKLCTFLEMDEEEQLLAQFIGLYHDIGRLEQLVHYKSFSDQETESHAELAVRLIEDNGLNKELDEMENNILRNAILLHNQLRLPKKEDEKVLLFARILRDADKLDLWEMNVNMYGKKMNNKLQSNNSNLSTLSAISDKVYDDIMQGKQVDLKNLNTQNDYKLMLMSMVFDINFKYSFTVVNQQQYIKRIYDTMPKTDRIIDSFRSIKIHIENQFLI